MDSRRDFLKKAILLSGTAGASTIVPSSIQKALSINPEVGSTYLDAEHIVILMQENRSFDHCYGSLKGVRGYNDPRAMTQPNGNVVWMQSNNKGETFIPFRFDIKDTKATWMGSIPHSRRSQVDADNYGKYDKWLETKRSGHNKYKEMPLTLGYYNREDLPFHYTFADAFTVCDQNFCSGMTSTWPNRFFLWSGTVRSRKSGETKAFIRNVSPYNYNITPWKSFPERLEEHNISWKVYQNTLSTGGGLTGDQRSWLGNFGCNPLEFFPQYKARFFKRYYDGLETRVKKLEEEIRELEGNLAAGNLDEKATEKAHKDLEKKKEVLVSSKIEQDTWSPENFEKLSDFQKRIYEKAFSTNEEDPDFLELTTLKYKDGNEEREIQVPKGDVLYQFRKDVDSGNLPTVSWLVPSQNFSDHPSAPWFGAWHTSEILNILTKNPEVWKKTIFILTYDENDGYFDHIPPYVVPDPRDEETGKCSPGINLTGAEFIRKEREVQQGVNKNHARTAPVGLGFRVPMVVASPWSRGGKVCSQIFDHTSVLQFLEHFLNEKYKTRILENNISEWRRTVTGDLTTVFDRYEGNEEYNVNFLEQREFIKEIYNAKFKKSVNDFRPLSASEIQKINAGPIGSGLIKEQEKGTRKARPIPYQLHADGRLEGGKFVLDLRAGMEFFGERSSGSPFKVYAPGKHKVNKATYKDPVAGKLQAARSWDFAVKAGEELSESWELADFENSQYHLRVYGPNGFFREFKGDKNDPQIKVSCDYERSRLLKTIPTGNVVLKFYNEGDKDLDVAITDESYKNPEITKQIGANSSLEVTLDLNKSSGWYDFSVQTGDSAFLQRFAGHVETGKESISDPAMGQIL